MVLAPDPLKRTSPKPDNHRVMYSDTLCTHCRLTLAAIALIAGVVRDMRRERPDDPTWRSEICPHCGEVTGVYDDKEGWAMGHRAPVVIPEPAFVAVS